METTSGLGEIRIILVGKTGAGKSLTWIIILGEEFFSDVNDCNVVKSRFSARQVAEIDSPGLFGRTDDISGDIIRTTAAFHSYKKRVIKIHFGESSFSAQQDSFPSCLHLLGKTGCCKSGTGISKLGTDDLMEVDRRNAKTTDRQIPSNKDIDTPGIFDTHLTKKDVYSKITQNDWREGIFNPRRKHLPVHQVIVLFLFSISFAQGISSHCEINHTMNCTDLFLICSFDTDIIQLAKNLYMNHEQNNSMDLEIILVCQTSSKGFLCETSPTYEFVSVVSNRLTVKIPEVSIEHVGKYWCDVQVFVDIDRKVCELSLPDTYSVVSDNFEQENGPHCKEYRSSPATIAIIVLSSSLGLSGTSLIFFMLYIFWKKHQIHYATRFNLKNCKSEIRTNNKHEGACELL